MENMDSMWVITYADGGTETYYNDKLSVTVNFLVDDTRQVVKIEKVANDLKRSCRNCDNRYRLMQYNHSGAVKIEDVDGFLCMGFRDDGNGILMNDDLACGQWTPKKYVKEQKYYDGDD